MHQELLDGFEKGTAFIEVVGNEPRHGQPLERRVPVCEAVRAHTLRVKTEAAYNRTDLFDWRRVLMNTWAKFATAQAADVVSIR